MKRLLFLSVSLLVFLTACNKGKSTAKKHFNLMEQCFSRYPVSDYKNHKISKLEIVYCLKPHSNEMKTTELSSDELRSYYKEFAKLINSSKYEEFMKEIVDKEVFEDQISYKSPPNTRKQNKKYQSSDKTNNQNRSSITSTSNILYDKRDGKSYKMVMIGNQIWMAENLKHKTNSGCYIYRSDENFQLYGYLYNWQTALYACPGGWHLPSDNEWKELESSSGMKRYDIDKLGWRGAPTGDNLKSQYDWHLGGNGIDKYGFCALPGGFISSYDMYSFIKYNAAFWSSTIEDNNEVLYRMIDFESGNILRQKNPQGSSKYSVRCVKNNN